jgi:phosphoribosylglycinamide formyltransferase 2
MIYENNTHPSLPELVVEPLWGTPKRRAALRVMLLGAGELGKEVVIALQRLGVEVIAADRYADAPAQQLAHHSVVLDMTDAQALVQAVEQFRPHVIVPEIEAIATDALVELEAKGQVRVVPNARAAQLTMNREGIRRLAAETLGLQTSAYRFADDLEQLRKAVQAIGLPCVVKPVMSSSGKGQSIIRDEAEIQAAWDHAQTAGRVGAGRVIVEGWVHFDYEITLLTVRAQAMDGSVQTRFCEPIGHLQVNGDYVESWQPHPMTSQSLLRAQAIAKAVTSELGGLGLFGVELFVHGDEVWFSEVSPRPHDTGLVTLVTQQQSEFDLHARALLGLPVDTTLRNCGASRVIYGGVDAKAVVFSGMHKALGVPGSELRLFGKPESFVKRRLGVGLAQADDIEQARQRARAVSESIQIKPVD